MTSTSDPIPPPPTTFARQQTIPLAWLTGEVLLLVGIATLALALRLTALTNYPLDNVQSHQALAALAVFNGDSPTSGYSPALLTLNTLAFWLFGPDDGATRLFTALLGTLLVVLPFGLRRQLGRGGVLFAALLLAVSATPLYWSRVNDGTMIAGIGLLLALVGVTHWLNGQSWSWYVIAVALALLLTSSPIAFTAIAVSLLLFVVVVVTNRDVLSQIQAHFSVAPRQWLQLSWVFGGVLVVLASAFLFNLGGIAEVSGLFTRWLGQFSLRPQPATGYPAFMMLLAYEPLLLVFGAAGVWMALRNQDLFDWLLAAWLALILMLDMLMGGRDAGQLLMVVIPLALLAGKQMGQLARGWLQAARFDAEGLFVAVGLMISVFAYISLATWSKCGSGQAGCDTAWILPLAGLLLLLGLTVVYAVWYDRAVAWRGLSAVLLLVLGTLSIGFAWRLSFGSLQNLPFQPMTAMPPSVLLRPMVAEMERVSRQQTGDSYHADVAVVGVDEPIVTWHLRDFQRTQYLPDWASATGATMILGRPGNQPLAEGYVGQDFSTVAFWRLQDLQGKAWVRWYLFRELPNHNPGHDQIVLWTLKP